MDMNVKWKGGLEFESQLPSGHSVTVDAKKESGGNDNGPRPTELILNGLAGCTGVDVIMILKKMNQEVVDFDMEVKSERAEEHPRRFTDIHLIYKFKGHNLDEKKVERAINLSEEKYCSASASLNANITSEYIIEEAE
ncbi:MAG: OsmC family protein [Bacillota bacterium]